MFKHPENEEDLFFSSIATSSKLASIFETTVVLDNSDSSSNQDLTYSAPKQPVKMTTQKPDKKVENFVSLVKVVYGYKYVNNTYESLGKVGFALVEYPEDSRHHIILYKNKNNHIFNIRINKKIIFTIQENKYLTLLDDQKKNWSLLFENKADLSEFFNKLETTDAKIVKTSDTNKLKDTNQPKIEEGTNETVVEITNETKAEMKDETESEITNKTVKEESIDSAKSKSDILTRMAKVGQLVALPSQTKIQKSEMDSEGEVFDNTMISNVTKRTKNVKNVSDLETVKTIFSPTHSQVLVMNKNQQLQENLCALLSENRTQNTEVRINLIKLEDKIDKLTEKIPSESNLSMNSDLMKLQLQNEQLKLELQKMQLNKMVTKSNPLLEASKKIEKGVQCNSNPLYGAIDSIDEMADTNENDHYIQSHLRCISETASEIHLLRNKYENLITEIGDLEKQNRKQELKINGLEIFFSEVQPLRKLVNEVDDVAITKNIDECYNENNELRNKLKDLSDSMLEYMSTIELQDRKINQLQNYLRTIVNNEEINVGENDVLHRVEIKLNDFDQYFQQTQDMKSKLEDALKTVRHFESKICDQEKKITDFILTYENKKETNREDSAHGSDIEISICSSCLVHIDKNKKIYEKRIKDKVESNVVEGKIEDKSKSELNAAKPTDFNPDDLDNLLKQNQNNESITTLIKEEMNGLYGELQGILKKNYQQEATSKIVQTTFKIINHIHSRCSD